MKDYNTSDFDKAQMSIYDKMIAHYNTYKELEEQLDDSIEKWNDFERIKTKYESLNKQSSRNTTQDDDKSTD